ncbi:MAG: hypothetical protein NXY57DRAFT_1112629 [Lentinula lateritia]|nr:MAG: hypothetical protein NXY57DRAFT_1112629 [Lentinula lateritia]
MFNSNNPSEESLVDLSIIAEASRKAALAVLQPADHIEVFQNLEGQKIDLSARSVRKRFKPGDHVEVMQGKNAGETGLVVAVSDTGCTPSMSSVNAAFLGFHRRKNFGQDRTSFAASGRRGKAVSGHGP